MTQKKQFLFSALAAATLWTVTAHGAPLTLVHDTWQDGDRTYPPAPVYSEAGVNSDLDDDLESAWFNSGAGAALTATPGNLRMDPADAPANWTTYSLPDPNVGLGLNDFFRFTWRFRTGDVSAADTGQNFRIAMVDSASVPPSRVTADGAAPSGVFLGLALFGNMAETTGNANSFELRERNNLPNTSILGDSSAWTSIANGLGTDADGYADNTQYAFTGLIKRNSSSFLDITLTMAGGNIGGTGSMSLHVIDTTPVSFNYDTFSIYVGDQSSTATLFDTSLFMVERGHDDPVTPEPESVMLTAMASLTALVVRRKRS